MALVVGATVSAAQVAAQDRVQVLSTGPGAGHFLTWHGKPIIPVGDSVTQGWFESGRDFDETAYLDALAQSGQNTVMLWSFIGTNAPKQIKDDRLGYDAPEVWPWRGSPDDASFDLTQLNPEYFQRLRRFVEAANERNLLVLITVFDGWPKRRFDGHPFNAALGNGPLQKNDQFVQLAHPGQAMADTFNPAWSWPEKNQYFQEQFALALIQAVGDLPNVIFEMFNEGEWYDPQLRLAHEQHFLSFFRGRTQAVLASNTDHIKLFSPHANADLNMVTLHNDWIGNFWIFQQGFERQPAKPYFQTEPVPEWNGREPTIEQLRRGVWERVLGCSGWVNQNDVSFGWNPHVPAAKLSKVLLEAYAYAGHAAQLMHENNLDFASMHPDGSVASSGIALVRPGSEYVIYCPHGSGWIWIDLSLASPTAVEMRWFSPRSGKYSGATTQTIHGITKLPTPDAKDWVLHLRLPQDLSARPPASRPAASEIPAPYEKLSDIVYAVRPEGELKLDLYLPRRTPDAPPPPMVLYIHGGSWRAHSKDSFEPGWLPLDGGFAFAAMNYRLSQQAKFPAQIHDAKAAVRQALRRHARQYGYAAEKLGILGMSAGGHLGCLLGVTAGNPQLEGEGPERAQSSAVQAVVAFYAVTDLPAVGELYERRPGKKIDMPGQEPIISLLGGTVAEKPQLARLASPALHVTSAAPPFMLIHGSADSLAPVDQSIRLHDALRAAGVPCDLRIVPGAEHGLERQPWMPAVHRFFQQHLQS